jgi:hypothetical protein
MKRSQAGQGRHEPSDALKGRSSAIRIRMTPTMMVATKPLAIVSDSGEPIFSLTTERK